MDPRGLNAIAAELIDLLQSQIEVVAGHKFDDLAEEDLRAYQIRKERIQHLRSELEKFAKPA